ncbi:choice-of-anchor M domain-containing protein [Streptomyces lushanensis]|uniref:choice-of-anchor M domain-containing protein n=1 Tax=Streptomyces lushanensis TaxID=1434255 RepID=UPI00082B7620|nr:choice-of-anchor M domain-containing protein [Streptomyces lushanensis]
MTIIPRTNGPLRAGTAVAVAAALFAGAFAAVTGGSAAAGAAPLAVVLDEGEIDFAPRIVDGMARLGIADRTGGAGGSVVWREPSTVVLHAKPETEYAIDGAMIEPVAMFEETPGYPVWLLNGVGSDDRFDLDPGWSTAELPTGRAESAEVRLAEVKGPGDFALFSWDWANGAEAEPLLVERLPEYSSFTLPDSDRFTPMWGFTAEGVYRLTFEISVGTGGGAHGVDRETVSVVVGDDIDPGQVLPGDGSTPAPTPTPASTPSGSGPGPDPTVSPAPALPKGHVIADGHIDLATRLVGGGLRFQIKDGAYETLVWREPESVVIHVKARAKRRIGAGYEFLGTVGDPVWWLPDQQAPGLVWPGWGSTELDPADFRGDLTYELTAVRGPGRLAVFQNSGLGGLTHVLDSGDGLPDSFSFAAHTHAHPVWAFTEEGVYRATFTMSGTLANGTRAGDSGTVAFAVGDIDPAAVVPGDGSGNGGEGRPTPSPSGTLPDSPAPAPPGPAGDSGGSGRPPDGPPVSGSDGGPATGSGGGSGPDGPSGGGASPRGGLAATGAGVLVPLAGAVVGVVAGGIAFLVARRRHRTRVPEAGTGTV